MGAPLTVIKGIDDDVATQTSVGDDFVSPQEPAGDSLSTAQASRCEIWAVAGGKGGTGKSFITSCMGATIAQRGKRVVMIDADLGGANLHSFLGVSRPTVSLTDFFDKKTPLKELIINTAIPNMGLITGNLHSLASDDIKYVQKLKLFR
ncbi:MAG TPA: P-loop NTPase, partial [Geobacterales bacterium]|nr:P-loop NTPase [Geobacterales bacterium]